MPVSRHHKLVVLGGERVGKTAIIEQFIFGNHVIGQSGLPTLGDVYEATVETEKGPPEKLHIFDTPGSLFTDKDKEYEQEHFLSIADGYLLVYEITSRASYDFVLSLRQKISSKNRDAPIVVLGNKSDLNAIREVDTAKASQQCKNHGARFYEVTVLDREGLKEPMCYISWRMANPGQLPYQDTPPWCSDHEHSALTCRPFPQLPPLSSSAKHSVATTTTSQSQPAKTRSNKCPSTTTSLNDGSEAADGESEEEEGEEMEGEEDSLEAGWKPFPDDAQFPRSGGGRLFFADCLSSRNKYRDDVI